MISRIAFSTFLLTLAACAPDLVGSNDSQPPGPEPSQQSCRTHKQILPFGSSQVTLGGQCLEESPILQGDVAACVVIDARHEPSACSCDASRGRVPVRPETMADLALARDSKEGVLQGWNCFCELHQLAGAAGESCRVDREAPTGSGFCDIDPSASPPLGSASLVAECPQDEPHLLRFVGGATAPVASEPQGEGYEIVCDVACE